jgi:hypothetical protein
MYNYIYMYVCGWASISDFALGPEKSGTTLPPGHTKLPTALIPNPSRRQPWSSRTRRLLLHSPSTPPPSPTWRLHPRRGSASLQVRFLPSPSRSSPQSPVAQSRRRGACGEAALVTPRSRAAPGMPRSRAAPGTRRSILCSPPSVDAADLQLPRGCSRCFLCLPPIAVRHGVAGGVDGHGRRGGDDAPHARSSSASLPFLHSSVPTSAVAPSWPPSALPALHPPLLDFFFDPRRQRKFHLHAHSPRLRRRPHGRRPQPGRLTDPASRQLNCDRVGCFLHT